MKFSEAFRRMQYGEKLKMPEWKGYWYWDENKQTIILHEYGGVDIDIHRIQNIENTLRFICDDEEEFNEYYSKLF